MATLTAAFIGDPLMRWAFPDAHTYLHAFPLFAKAYGTAGIASGSAFRAGGFGGVSIWLSPDHRGDDKTAAAVCKASMQPGRLDEFGRLMEEVYAYHPQDEPIWYLPFIGVDAAHQGHGLGSALMKHTLAMCDTHPTRAFLESSNPANISLYERHGFEVMARVQFGSSPPVHPMIREKR